MSAVKRKAPAGSNGDEKRKKARASAAAGGGTLHSAAPTKLKTKGKLVKGDSDKKKAAKLVPQNSAERKAMIRAKKEQKNANFPLVQECVFIWEELRPRDATLEDKRKLVSKVVGKAKGKFKELSNNHASSRVVQACLKYGMPEQRKLIWNDCKEHLVELSRSNYGSFVVRKLIDTAKKDELPGILRAFQGNVPLLFRHPCGSAVMSDLYDALPSKERNAMVAEFYSKEHVLFGSSHQDAEKASLQELWRDMDAAKRRAVMLHLTQRLQPIIEKGLLDPTPMHRLVYEYLLLASGGALEDAVELLSGERLLRMVHTHHGAKVGCMVAAYGTPKDRKKLVKALKTHVLKVASDEFAYAVLIKILSCVDDTQLMRKVIIHELVDSLAEICTDKHGSKVLLHLLHPECKRYLPPHIMQMLQPQARLVSVAAAEAVSASEIGADAQAGDGAGSASEEALTAVGVSKKDPETRRVELLGHGKGSLAAALLEHCRENVSSMLRSPIAADIVVELCHGDCHGKLWQVCEGDVRALHEAVAAAAALDPRHDDGMDADEADGATATPAEPLMEHYFGSRAILKMVSDPSADEQCKAACSAFCQTLWDLGVQGRCDALIKTHAAKIVAALANGGNNAVSTAVRKELATCLDNVEAWCSGSWKTKGKM